MLPLSHRIAFLAFACTCLLLACWQYLRLARRIVAGAPDSDRRTDDPARRLWYSLRTTLLQSRTFRKRPVVSFFHSLIFYGFVFYLLVNAVDVVDGYHPLEIRGEHAFSAAYLLAADILSALVLIGVAALVLRRFFLPSRNDFRFNQRTLLHEKVKQGSIARDSLIVSAFIALHVGSRSLEMGARLRMQGADRFEPFATLLSHAVSPQHAQALRILGFWGALGSVFAFLLYFPFTKHIHLFMTPVKYAVARDVPSGVLPAMDVDMTSDEPVLGAERLENLAWPRLLDAYACIQCNRCQDVCPATATGKSLSPSALEINKRMELNMLALHQPGFERGEPSPRPLLSFALSAEAAWACTTCGACMQACPVQDEPMLDIIDIRRQQVMMEGSFPPQLQAAFRGMERVRNPWGLPQDTRMQWAEELTVKTIEENSAPDVLYWVGCAASYDPQAQKTARSLVNLLKHAGVNFSVLGKKECCTGDTARRAGNEYLYRQLAEQNIETLNAVKPRRIVASCPHCLNAIGKEYAQLGGNFEVLHHTEYLDALVREGKLDVPSAASPAVSFHDPCYLGRHNGVFDAPRSLLHILSNDVREMDRSRENSFCCGAGGAQFWKEEEQGEQKIAANRMQEAERVLTMGERAGVLAVGCPFCKSMLQSTAPSRSDDSVVVKDIAELLWERVEGVTRPLPATSTGAVGGMPSPEPSVAASPKSETEPIEMRSGPVAAAAPQISGPASTRRKWNPPNPGRSPGMQAQSERNQPTVGEEIVATEVGTVAEPQARPVPEVKRSKWTPKSPNAAATGHASSDPAAAQAQKPAAVEPIVPSAGAAHQAAAGQSSRRKWSPIASAPVSPDNPMVHKPDVQQDQSAEQVPTAAEIAAASSVLPAEPQGVSGEPPATTPGASGRRKWTPRK